MFSRILGCTTGLLGAGLISTRKHIRAKSADHHQAPASRHSDQVMSIRHHGAQNPFLLNPKLKKKENCKNLEKLLKNDKNV